MRTLVALLLALLLAGCGNERPPTTPSYAAHKAPPSASYTIEQVRYDAARWVGMDATQRSWCNVRDTGSMLPMFAENSVLLLERSDGTDLRVGDVALYATDGENTVSHRVRVVGDGALIFTGDNNPGTGSDGWIAKERVRWRVAGILYSRLTKK